MRIEKQAEAQGARRKEQGEAQGARYKVRGTKAKNEARRKLGSRRGTRLRNKNKSTGGTKKKPGIRIQARNNQQIGN